MFPPTMSDTCIYCGHVLVPNPEVPHWKHCPTCEGEWVAKVERVNTAYGLLRMKQETPRYVSLGRPTINGHRS